MKKTIAPLMPDGMPIDLNVDETWLAKQMAETGKSADEVIWDELDRALDIGLKKMAEDQRKAIEDMLQRAAHNTSPDGSR